MGIQNRLPFTIEWLLEDNFQNEKKKIKESKVMLVNHTQILVMYKKEPNVYTHKRTFREDTHLHLAILIPR